MHTPKKTNYKCRICKGNLNKPEEENEVFWDNMQTLMNILWRNDYKYGLKDTSDPDIFKRNARGFERVCKYTCCSQKCRDELRKRAGAYLN